MPYLPVTYRSSVGPTTIYNHEATQHIRTDILDRSLHRSLDRSLDRGHAIKDRNLSAQISITIAAQK